MKTNDLVMVGLGFIAGYFLKNQWDKRNAVVETPNDDTNYVFSKKYKDCEVKVNEMMSLAKFAQGTDLVAYNKRAIDSCMKKA
jgi:hypothetical protein